jgi:hypothetical protein
MTKGGDDLIHNEQQQRWIEEEKEDMTFIN